MALDNEQLPPRSEPRGVRRSGRGRVRSAAVSGRRGSRRPHTPDGGAPGGGRGDPRLLPAASALSVGRVRASRVTILWIALPTCGRWAAGAVDDEAGSP